LVVIPDTGAPSIDWYETAAGLATRIQELDGTGVTVMSFHGRRLAVSPGPFRYLLDREGDPPIPLFDTPRTDNLTWDLQAHLGEDASQDEFALGSPEDVPAPAEDAPAIEPIDEQGGDA
jgi:hypothetical protein